MESDFLFWVFVSLIVVALLGVTAYKMDPRTTWKHALILTAVVGIVGIAGAIVASVAPDSPIRAAMNSAIAGLVTALALRLIYPSLKKEQLVIIVCGWAVGSLMGSFLSYMYDIDSLVVDVVHGFIGGSATGWGLRSANRALSWNCVGIVAASWAVGMTAGDLSWKFIYPRVMSADYTVAVGWELVMSAIFAAIVVAIGGGATLFVMKRAPYARVE